MDNLLARLATRLGIQDGDIVTGDEVRNWPDGKLQDLLAEGILQEIEPGQSVICDQCDEQCSITPQRTTDPQTGRMIGFHICMRDEAGGRIEVDLDRLRRWRINSRKLSQLGYTSNRRPTTSSRKRKDKKENQLFLLRTALLQHHGVGNGEINWEPATQKRLSELTDWKQPKIHRMMKAMFGDEPMRAYKQRCKERTLKGYLLRNDNGSCGIEAYAPSSEE